MTDVYNQKKTSEQEHVAMKNKASVIGIRSTEQGLMAELFVFLFFCFFDHQQPPSDPHRLKVGEKVGKREGRRTAGACWVGFGVWKETRVL